ncbi:RIP metalloprotease RseP [Rubrivirga sp. S365]|uniref:Zinc metalloprotease n=1 Tax=Rubrivirga litoralis TaxID=3075598 RepID=A0ABU3BQM8_9BACT|nr:MULTISPECIES: RIP metalloprotease RseP [unclassified Rubrivirga]MDT0631592.1 RIP metalloprotease RseP [Rubrivirga sp. F394]MDT7857237.1 RIP metalloprotease RseP [Rubrivirga sp. S365]
MDAILNSLSYFLWVAVALGILVTIHELGHFLAARLFKMRVDAFSIGFPPNIVDKQVGATRYRLGAVPLGGYVKIAGMVDESLDAEGLESEPAPDEFRAKPVWQRMVVISAGVVFNLILASLLYAALAFAYGVSYTPLENIRLEVTDGSIASDLGLETGDRIVAVNGERVERFEEVFTPGALSADPFRLTVERGGEEVELDGPDDLLTRFSRRQREVEEAGEPVSLGGIFGADIQLPTVLAGTAPGSAAAQAGLQAGDRILAVDGEPVDSWGRLTDRILASDGRPLAVRWARPDSLEEGGAEAAGGARVVQHRGAATVYEATVAPRRSGDRYVLGIQQDITALGQRVDRVGAGTALASGVERTASITGATFAFIGKLVTGRESVRENVGGPLIIAKQSKEAADRGLRSFWEFVAYLSIALAVFNVLPIPALDGGHLVFLAYEAVARREPSLKVRMVVQQVGVALILALMVFVIFNDAVRWFG